MKEVWYIAHPVTGDPEGNCKKAIEWVRWLTLNEPSRVYIAPWVAEVLAFVGQDIPEAFYDRVLADDQDVVSRLDGILLVGGRISRGMQLEREAAQAHDRCVADWSELAEPPPDGTAKEEFLRDLRGDSEGCGCS